MRAFLLYVWGSSEVYMLRHMQDTGHIHTCSGCNDVLQSPTVGEVRVEDLPLVMRKKVK